MHPGHRYAYSNTNYILAQMVIERATHDTYADQLTKRIIKPLGLRDTCLAPYTCPAAAAARMPTGYFAESGVPGRAGAAARTDLGASTSRAPV